MPNNEEKNENANEELPVPPSPTIQIEGEQDWTQNAKNLSLALRNIKGEITKLQQTPHPVSSQKVLLLDDFTTLLDYLFNNNRGKITDKTKQTLSEIASSMLALANASDENTKSIILDQLISNIAELDPNQSDRKLCQGVINVVSTKIEEERTNQLRTSLNKIFEALNDKKVVKETPWTTEAGLHKDVDFTSFLEHFDSLYKERKLTPDEIKTIKKLADSLLKIYGAEDETSFNSIREEAKAEHSNLDRKSSSSLRLYTPLNHLLQMVAIVDNAIKEKITYRPS